MSNQLVYFELHVDNETFYVHGVVNAKDKKHALDNLSGLIGKNFHLQLKGALGPATEKNMIKCLRDSIPKFAYNDSTKI